MNDSTVLHVVLALFLSAVIFVMFLIIDAQKKRIERMTDTNRKLHWRKRYYEELLCEVWIDLKPEQRRQYRARQRELAEAYGVIRSEAGPL